jgi:hypothetical protein
MIILGAGASKAFSLPDLHDLTKEIRRQLPNDPFKEIEQILNQSNDLNPIFYSENELDLERSAWEQRYGAARGLIWHTY